MTFQRSHYHSKSRTGRDFSLQEIEAVWRKGQIVPGYDPAHIRKDRCGAWIQRREYGNCNSSYGWEIDHIRPVSKGGTDDLSNLQPLHWKNNRNKGDNYPQWTCAIRAV